MLGAAAAAAVAPLAAGTVAAAAVVPPAGAAAGSVGLLWTRRPCCGGPSLKCREVAALRAASAAPWPPGHSYRPGAVLGPEKVCQFQSLLQQARWSGSAAHS